MQRKSLKRWRPRRDSNSCYRRERVNQATRLTVVHVRRWRENKLFFLRVSSDVDYVLSPYSGHSGYNMSRTVRSAQLETRAARLRLKPRKKPYRAASAKQGLHLGYRRIADKNGSWIAFTYQGSSGSYSERAFAQADDYSSVSRSASAIGRRPRGAPLLHYCPNALRQL